MLITRNEEEAIAKVLDDVFRALPGVHLYVIDDSDDRTPELAAAKAPRVGRAPPGVRSRDAPGADDPDEPIVATVDADDTYPPEVFPQLIEMVRGGRDVAGAEPPGTGRPSSMPLVELLAQPRCCR